MCISYASTSRSFATKPSTTEPMKARLVALLVIAGSPWLATHGMGGEDAFPIWTAPVDKFAGFHRWQNDRAPRPLIAKRSEPPGDAATCRARGL